MQRLQGKVAIVTGGGGRIGAATARRLASEGARVVVADVVARSAQSVAEQIGRQALAMPFDAGDPASIAHLVEQTVTTFGRLDVLHNNAALVEPDFLERDTNVIETSIETWDRTMDVNLRGYMLACKHAIPHMIAAGGGSIINTTSNAALAGDVLRIAYGASKAGIIALTRHIATQHGRQNIRCNAIAPGLIVDSGLEETMPDFLAMTARHVLLPRHGRGEDMAAMVAFFASDDAAFVTGQVISCDGGQLAHQAHYADLQ